MKRRRRLPGSQAAQEPGRRRRKGHEACQTQDSCLPCPHPQHPTHRREEEESPPPSSPKGMPPPVPPPPLTCTVSACLPHFGSPCLPPLPTHTGWLPLWLGWVLSPPYPPLLPRFPYFSSALPHHTTHTHTHIPTTPSTPIFPGLISLHTFSSHPYTHTLPHLPPQDLQFPLGVDAFHLPFGFPDFILHTQVPHIWNTLHTPSPTPPFLYLLPALGQVHHATPSTTTCTWFSSLPLPAHTHLPFHHHTLPFLYPSCLPTHTTHLPATHCFLPGIGYYTCFLHTPYTFNFTGSLPPSTYTCLTGFPMVLPTCATPLHS